jgi:hypothetical protein
MFPTLNNLVSQANLAVGEATKSKAEIAKIEQNALIGKVAAAAIALMGVATFIAGIASCVTLIGIPAGIALMVSGLALGAIGHDAYKMSQNYEENDKKLASDINDSYLFNRTIISMIPGAVNGLNKTADYLEKLVVSNSAE